MGGFNFGGDPRFYFSPDDAGITTKTITIGEPATVVDAQPLHKADAAAAIGYQVYRSNYGSALAVRIAIERFADIDGSRVRQVKALLNHLERGGWVAFSHDHARTWATRATTAPGSGDLNIATAGQLFGALSGSAAIGIGDHMVIQSPNPASKREQIAVSTFNIGTGLITMGASSSIAFDHTSDTLVRWEGFLPRLVLPPGVTTQDALTDEYRNTWTLDITLWTQPDLEHAAVAA